MNKRFLAFALLLLFTGCTEKTPTYSEYWLNWGDTQLAHWLSSTTQLEADTDAYCQNNLELVALQNQIQEVALRWATLNGLPYHAISDLSLNFELHFWPDRRDMTRARLSRRLQSEEPLTLETLEAATAAEKGLLALEWAGFAEDLDRQQRCLLLPAISTQYLNNVQRISSYHDEHPLVMPEWTVDSQSPEGKSIALNLLFQQLAYLSNSLRNSMNASTGELIPVLAQGWRMGASTEIFSASLEAVIQHLKVLNERVELTAATQDQLQTRIATLETLTSELSGEDVDWQELQDAVVVAERVIEGPVAQEQNIMLGFSNYDGD
jgi:hypothetical protein